MRGNRAGEALRRFVDSQNEALNCLTAERLIAFPVQPADRDPEYAVQSRSGKNLGGSGLVALRGDRPVFLESKQVLAISTSVDSDTLAAVVVSYAYTMLVSGDGVPREIVAFHWTPTGSPPQRRYPHLHVGSLVAAGSRFRPRDFNKLHIPTGPLSLEAVLLLAVEELGVEPARGRERGEVVGLLRGRSRAAGMNEQLQLDRQSPLE